VTWERFYDHVTSLILRDRNYPSVMGWSVENEIRMALATHSPSKKYIHMVQEKVCKMMDIVQKLDPTRDWISADGSLDWFGRFPTLMAHYVSKQVYEYAKQVVGKPVGIGEGTIGYFGTPVHASAFIGDLAFRSIEDRMKGVAVEAYADLKAQFLADFDYMSVFNLVWYGLKPLPLGHANPVNAPTVNNGIVFSPYREGKPGVQPERLGPYCTTLNPGYDPNLPLYAPWPLYDAIKSVFSPGGPLPSAYEKVLDSPPQKPLLQVDNPEPVVFLGGPNSIYCQGLRDSGIKFSQNQIGTFVFADLASISSEQEKILKTRIESMKAGGGTVFLSGLTSASEPLLEDLTGKKIEIFDREASSLNFAGEYADTDPLVDHFRLQELYFSEDEDYIIQRYGIRCDDTRSVKALLKACSCDWRMWNRRGEPSKTGALYRSEKELPEANALVKCNVGKAKILLCALEMTGNPSSSKLRLSSARKLVWNRLLRAAGAKVSNDFGREAPSLEGNRIIRVLAVGFFGGSNSEVLLARDFLGGESDVAPVQGDAIIRGDFTTHWQVERAEQDGFRFRVMGFNGPKDNSASYMSFYLNSPRRIDDLLSEPNAPELYLNIETTCGIRVWLNGEEIFTRADISVESVKLQIRLLLGQGSNHVLIKVVNSDTDYVVRAYLSSTHQDYIGKLDSFVER
jgi:beta-galactosidase